MNIRKTTLAEYVSDAEHRFGVDRMKWRFICPACGNIASAEEYKLAGAPEGAVGFSCIGRWTGAKRSMFETDKPGPCDYTGGGLICISPVEFTDIDRPGMNRYFELANLE